MVDFISLTTSIILYIHIILIKNIDGLVDKDSNVFCSNHIYEKDSNISTYEINNLCKLIVDDRRFIIQLDSSEFIDRKLYKRDSREFFLLTCKTLKLCYKGYGISVYHNNIKTLSISMGDYSFKQITQDQINLIVSKAIKSLFISESIAIVIREIERIIPVQSDDKIPVHNDTDSDDEEGYNKVNPIVILIVILIPFILISMLICLVYKYNTMDLNDISPSVIHEYFKTLQELYKEIISNKTKMITLNKCILCFKIINPHLQKMFYEMEEIKLEETHLRSTAIKKSKEMPLLKKKSVDFSIDNINTRFSCGHVYHNECLMKIKRNQCLMCRDKEESIAIMNRSSQQVIKESNIICLLYNFNKIYSQAELSCYNEVYSNELEDAKDILAKRKLFHNSFE